MKHVRAWWSTVAWMVLACLSVVSSAHAGENTFLVGFSHAEDTAAIRSVTTSFAGRVVRCYRVARICVVELPNADQTQISRLETLSGVRYVEHDRRILSPSLAPARDDETVTSGTAAREAPPDISGTEDCPDLWELPFIDIPDAWSTAGGWGGAAPVIAIEDSGFLTSHEELVGQISGQFDYGNWDTDPEVEWDAGVPAHGTFIAGMIAARGDNDAGRVGILPEGRLNLQKIADNDGALYFSYAVSAMADIAEGNLGVRVLSYSIAGPTYTQSFLDAVNALEDAGILLVTAAGNCSYANCSDADNDQNPMYPGNFSGDHIVVVAGIQRDGSFNPYSHYGHYSVDLAAPGVDLCSLGVYSDTDYYTAGGTSYATPIVSGVAGLLLEAYPDLTTTELARVLRASVIKTDELATLVRSGGYLSASRALSTAVPRLGTLPDIVIDGYTVLEIPMENPAADGTGTLVLFHDDLFQVTDASSWEVKPFEAGDTLTLPDAGTLTATASGTLLRGPLPSRSRFSLPVTLRGLEEGRTPMTIRLVAESAGADYLNAPYDTGSRDETGFLAFSSYVEVRAVGDPSPTPTGTPVVLPSPTPTEGPTDTPTPSTTGTPAPATPTMAPSPSPKPNPTPAPTPTPGTTPAETSPPPPTPSPTATPAALETLPPTTTATPAWTPPPESPTPVPATSPCATCAPCQLTPVPCTTTASPAPCQATPVPCADEGNCDCPAEGSPCPGEVSGGCNTGGTGSGPFQGWWLGVVLGVVVRKRTSNKDV